jgi:hypothetical protein
MPVARMTVPEGTYSVTPELIEKVVHWTSLFTGVADTLPTTVPVTFVQLVLAAMLQIPLVVLLEPSP